MTAKYTSYPHTGVWFERVRLGAELMVAVGGATLAVLATWDQLRDLEMARHELLHAHPEPPDQGGHDGAR